MGIAKQFIATIDELLPESGVILSTAEQFELERLRDDFASSDQAQLKAIRDFLRRRQDLAKVVGEQFVEKAFQFLDEELDKYEEIKRHRDLTEEELDYGRSVLPALVTSIVKLCSSQETNN